MDKLEHYLDQVCRGIAGPRSLRQHIRQELREHLMDAVSEHENAGVTHEAAIERALEEFGGPDEVRRELEATHGHRLMTVVVDKAMQWKEKTMKAKWLWTTWAHLALGLVIVLELTFVLGAVTLVLPKFLHYYDRGWLSGTSENVPAVERWAFSFFVWLRGVIRDWPWWVVPLALLWGVFEWRTRNENKSTIRLALLGTVAAKLLVVALLVAAFMILPMAAEMSRLAHRDQEPDVKGAVAELEMTLPALENALASKNWPAVALSIAKVGQPIYKLNMTGASPSVLVSSHQTDQVNAIRAQLAKASRAATDGQRGAYSRNESAVEDTIREARAVLEYARPTTVPAGQ